MKIKKLGALLVSAALCAGIFIVQADSTHLDGQYAAFGKVTKGMDIVDKICKDTPVTDSNGTVDRKSVV